MDGWMDGWMYACMYACMYVCVYVCVCMCACVCVGIPKKLVNCDLKVLGARLGEDFHPAPPL